MRNKSIICGVLFASGAIAFYEGNNMLSALLCFYGPYAIDRNNYIKIHPTQAQVAKMSYHDPSKYINQNVSPQLQYLLFRIMYLFISNFVVLFFSVITDDLTLSSKDKNVFIAL
jgi:hypothetical protein